MNSNNGWAYIREKKSGAAVWVVGIANQIVARGIAESVHEARSEVRWWRQRIKEELQCQK